MPQATPDRFFDLIMKGGVTSGVVYPPAIHHIAREGYLHGIGGTSAGARPHLDLRLREPLTPAQPDPPKTADAALVERE